MSTALKIHNVSYDHYLPVKITYIESNRRSTLYETRVFTSMRDVNFARKQTFYDYKIQKMRRDWV